MLEKLFGEVKGIFNTITLIELLLSVLFIIIGLIFYSNPSISNTIVSILVGILLVFNGCLSIYSYLKRGSIVLFNHNFIFGVILIIIGLLSMFLGKSLTIIIAIYLFFIGIQKLLYSLFLKKFNESSWILVLVMGILIIVIGIVSLFTDGELTVRVAGVLVLVFGLMNLAETILLRRRSKYFLA